MDKRKILPVDSNTVHQISDSFIEFSVKVKDHANIDWLGRFKDVELQLKYEEDCLHRRISPSFFILTITFLLWAFLETAASLTIHSHISHEITFGIISFLLISLLLGLTCCLCSSNNVQQTWNKPTYCFKRSTVQLCFTILFNSLFILKMLKYFLLDPDHQIVSPLLGTNHDEIEQRHYPFAALYLPSPEMLLIISYFALLLPMFFHHPQIHFVLFHLCITFVFFLYCIRDSRIGNLFPMVITELLVTSLFYRLHIERVERFYEQFSLSSVNLKKYEDIAKENLEIRQMVGNVAHDLKTPLASFTNGVSIIEELLKKSQETIRTFPGAHQIADAITDVNTSIQSCLLNIQNTNTFMLMSINRFLDFSKINEKKKLTPKYETVHLHEALQFPVDCMSNIQERIDIQLEPMHEDICPFVITDKQWLQENILCLLSNAVKYSTEGPVVVSVGLLTSCSTRSSFSTGPSPTNAASSPVRQSSLQSASGSNSCTVRLYDGRENFEKPKRNTSASHHSSTVTERVSIDNSPPVASEDCKMYLLFEVEDHGIGMSAEAQANLFSPFQQAQSLAGGTGLGLFSLSKRIEALKGSYGVRSRKDGKKGSLFWFTIPYRPDHLTASNALNVSREMAMSASHKRIVRRTRSMNNLLRASIAALSPVSILLVDDSPSILKISSMMLRRQGFTITTAENGEIALKRIEEKWKSDGKGFDVVLMDLQMPVMDGLEATRRLRSYEDLGVEWMKSPSGGKPHQLVFGTSANYDDDTQQMSMKVGFDDFLEKPFPIESLQSLLHRHSAQI